MTNESKGMLYGLLAVTAFGLTLPATRHVVAWLDPVFIGLGRAVLAGLCALIILLVSKSPLPTMRQLRMLLVIALGVVIGFPVLSAWSMQSLAASHGGVVLGILPLATAIAGVFVSQERPSVWFWLTSLLGSILVVVYSLLHSSGTISLGDAVLFLAVICAAIGYALGAQLARQIAGWQVICWALVVSLPFIILPTWWSAPDDFRTIPASGYASFLYLALVSQLSGFFLWYKGLALGGVARVSQTQLVQPFVTIIAAAWLLQEAIDLTTIIFALLVIITVAVSKRMPISNNST